MAIYDIDYHPLILCLFELASFGEEHKHHLLLPPPEPSTHSFIRRAALLAGPSLPCPAKHLVIIRPITQASRELRFLKNIRLQSLPATYCIVFVYL
ncbi:hypothetical protein E2C01_081336 [Portunus trituberculatus]|uniref:Uncharacterized protein n=1 Tax=Portunus trituberculatus TaxID=210409 RepID=A0A5B7IXQ1_PORTR|nr:hypothetical protein [Portunus trituberculatus]